MPPQTFVKETVKVSFVGTVCGHRKAPYQAARFAPYDTELQPFGWIIQYSSSSVGFIRAPGEKAARVHRGGNHSHWASGLSLHAAHFARAQRRHPLPRVINLLTAVQANLIGLLLERERPRLTPMPAAEYNIVEETKQVLNPCHHKKSPLTKHGVVLKNRTVKMHSARKCRVCRRENTAFVADGSPKSY
jgi:hypothetical protein